MPNAQTILELMQSRRSQNLAYFEQHHPKIFQAFHDYRLQNAKLNISPDGDDINLLVDGKAMYEKDYRLTGERECTIFLHSFPRNKVITTAKAPARNYFPYPRTFHSLGRELIDQSPVKNPAATAMISRDNYPLVVVTGVGLGGHIESLCNTAQVNHFIIYEPNPDVFAASLYTLDWAGLFAVRAIEHSLSAQIFVGNILEEETKFAAIWNSLSRKNPLFPTSTYYFNHLGKEENIQLINRFNKDISLYFSVWGFYDDELNQLNQCLHNIRGHSSVLSRNTVSSRETPVFIIGAGPSLDSRIEDIKRFKDQAIVVSCGTALKSLYFHGIKPDFHVELESHKIVVEALQAINDPDWLKELTIVSPSHIHPDVIAQFGRSLIYYKSESAFWEMFGQDSAAIPYGTPTCTNAALAFCHYFNFTNLYLFGCDYGFKDTENHHAKGSIYYEGKFKQHYSNAQKNPRYQNLTDIHGEPIYSTDLLYTSLRTVEKLAYHLDRQNRTLKNCSGGVDLRYTEVTDSEALAEQLNTLTFPDKSSVIDDFHQSASILSEKRITHGIQDLKNALQKLFTKIDTKVFTKNLDFEETVFEINYLLEHPFREEHAAFYWFIRGSIWHLNHVFYTHELCLRDTELQRKFQLKYRKIMKKFADEIGQDLDTFSRKDFTADDPWLKVPLEELPEVEA